MIYNIYMLLENLMKLISKGLLFTALITSGHLLWSHHGDAGRFEEETTTIHGTVIALQLVNPHSLIILNLQEEGGAIETWQAELGGPNNLTGRYGWTRETLLAGDEIYVTGRLLKSGEPFINLTERARIVKVDGCEEIYASRSLPVDAIPCS
jgi:hypothetical protein